MSLELRLAICSQTAGMRSVMQGNKQRKSHLRIINNGTVGKVFASWYWETKIDTETYKR